MKLFVPLRIGWRFYRARQNSRFINFISFASTAGVALGVAVLILLLSVMNGFENELETRLLGVIPQAELNYVQQPIKNWEHIVKQANTMDGIVAAAPMVNIQGLVQKTGGFVGLSIVGITPELENKVSTLSQYMPAETWNSLNENTNNIVLGQGMLDKLKLKVGDKISFYLPAARSSISATGNLGRIKSHSLVISGTFNVGGELEYSTAYVPMAYAQKLLNIDESVTGVRIKVQDIFDAPNLIKTLGYAQEQSLYITDWTRTQGHLYRDIQLVKTLMVLVLALVIAVACFNIVSTLIMTVRDKLSEIAILMTMGLKRSGVVLIFVVQGALNGMLGCMVGGVIGVLLATNISSISQLLESMLGRKLLSTDVYFIDFLPSELILNDVIGVISIALVMSLLATLYPAYRASKIAPATALAGR